MDRIPGTQGGGGGVADDAIDRQASPPIVTFEERIVDSKNKNQSAQIAAGQLFASVGQAGGDGDGHSITTLSVRSSRLRDKTPIERLKHVLMTFGKFVGPGFMVSVAYSQFPPLFFNTMERR